MMSVLLTKRILLTLCSRRFHKINKIMTQETKQKKEEPKKRKTWQDIQQKLFTVPSEPVKEEK